MCLHKFIRDDGDKDAGSGVIAMSSNNGVKFPFKQQSYHIRHAFDLFGHIHIIINDGIK